MEFTLVYRGLLKANGRAADKHTIRREFHPQLSCLFNQEPLVSIRERIIDPSSLEQGINIVQDIGPFRFAPLISERLYLIGELSITLFRPEPPGSILIQGGDIDNRLKTLLDALKMPKPISALPSQVAPQEDENPFFCLLEDDALITSVSVSTERLLEVDVDPSDALVLIKTRVRRTRDIFLTGGLGL